MNNAQFIKIASAALNRSYQLRQLRKTGMRKSAGFWQDLWDKIGFSSGSSKGVNDGAYTSATLSTVAPSLGLSLGSAASHEGRPGLGTAGVVGGGLTLPVSAIGSGLSSGSALTGYGSDAVSGSGAASAESSGYGKAYEGGFGDGYDTVDESIYDAIPEAAKKAADMPATYEEARRLRYGK